MRHTPVIKCLVSGGLIMWLLHDMDVSDIVETARSAKAALLLLAFGSHFVGYYLSAQRWRLLMRTQGVEASVPFLIGSCMVGTFFTNVLPLTVDGDVMRAYDSWRLGLSRGWAVTVIFVDRLLGISALLLLGLAALLLSQQFMGHVVSLLLWVAGSIAGMVAVASLAWGSIKRARLPYSTLRRTMPRRVQAGLRQIPHAFTIFRRYPRVLFATLGISLALQANVVTHYYLIAQALRFPVPFSAFWLIVPLAIFTMMVPVSTNAIGVRENVFAFSLGLFGVMPTEAIAYAWLAYGMTLGLGLLGAMVYVIRQKGGRSAATHRSAVWQHAGQGEQ